MRFHSEEFKKFIISISCQQKLKRVLIPGKKTLLSLGVTSQISWQSLFPDRQPLNQKQISKRIY